MKKFEYKRINEPLMSVEFLNKLGSEGWEYCSNPTQYTYVFKREICEDEDEDENVTIRLSLKELVEAASFAASNGEGKGSAINISSRYNGTGIGTDTIVEGNGVEDNITDVSIW